MSEYNAVMYLRLSKEDGDKAESYSISNQRDLIKQYLIGHPEIKLVCEKVDDGYTGTNFDRAGFKEMIGLIEKGEINCVIVKDLSRFARNYIGSGYYLQTFFPTHNIRFIAINDNIDSINDTEANNQLIMSIKNVINDSYVRDISVKIRSQFEIKRKKGEYIGAFVVYGYKKSNNDKHKLEIDENAAEIVKSIFNLKIEGLSASAISRKLNLLDVPSPAEYKKMSGSNYSANLQKKHISLWSAKAVLRILKNEIYTGILIQGKYTTPNYRIKKRIERDTDEWSIKEEAHEAVISKQIFDTVQNLLKQDTVTVNTKKTPYLFSGFLYCADCKNSMVRRKVNDKYGTYVYYTCSYNRLGLGCSSHSIREDALSETVKNAISVYCRSVWELCDTLKGADADIVEQERIQSIENAVAAKEEKIKDLNITLSVIEKRFSENKDDSDSYRQLKEDILSEIAYIENEILTLANEKKEVNSNINCYIAWLEEFNNMGEIKELNRTLLANIIERICIHEDKSIVIKFRYSDEYKKLLNLCEKLNTREAV